MAIDGHTSTPAPLLAAALLAVGFTAGGYLAGRGVLQARREDRVVTVKGVAEIETRANLATYPLRFTVTAGDPAAGKRRIDEQAAQLIAFLRERGFEDAELIRQRLEVQDVLAQGYRPDNYMADSRFILALTILVRSNRIDLVSRIGQDVGDLVQRGIVLGETGGPTYVLTADQLNEVKPDLIRRATLAAKQAADEFAAVSGSRVGRIRHANQGALVILARDDSPSVSEEQSIEKRVRAVATVDYTLVE